MPRNVGMRVARAERIASLDSDYLWYPSKLEILTNSITECAEVDAVRRHREGSSVTERIVLQEYHRDLGSLLLRAHVPALPAHEQEVVAMLSLATTSTHWPSASSRYFGTRVCASEWARRACGAIVNSSASRAWLQSISAGSKRQSRGGYEARAPEWRLLAQP